MFVVMMMMMMMMMESGYDIRIAMITMACLHSIILLQVS